LRLLREATMGLIYMHDQGVIHGNLRGGNILIGDDGRARLADFGLLRIVTDDKSDTTTTMGPSTAQWTSPELLVPQNFGLEGHATKESDCYALGMTIFEVLSGQTPFSDQPLFAVTWKILEGTRPTRPEGEEGAWLTDAVWRVLEGCWRAQPGDRITINAVLLGLEGIPPPFKPSSGVNGLGGGAPNTDVQLDSTMNSP